MSEYEARNTSAMEDDSESESEGSEGPREATFSDVEDEECKTRRIRLKDLRNLSLGKSRVLVDETSGSSLLKSVAHILGVFLRTRRSCVRCCSGGTGHFRL